MDPYYNYYVILGVDSSQKVIRDQYKKLALLYHPDKHGQAVSEVATRKFREVQEAYNCF